jgi:DNA-binding NarL/FixJ family response regulator
MTRSIIPIAPRIRVLATSGTITGAETNDAGGSTDCLEDLPNREYQVLWYLGHGYPVSEIAEHLHVSVPTVETYLSRLKDKLGCDDHTDLLKCAIQWAHSQSML